MAVVLMLVKARIELRRAYFITARVSVADVFFNASIQIGFRDFITGIEFSGRYATAGD